MKLEYRLFPCWPEPQFTSFHFFPLSGLQYKTTGDALSLQACNHENVVLPNLSLFPKQNIPKPFTSPLKNLPKSGFNL
jgi:hypothetical protein